MQSAWDSNQISVIVTIINTILMQRNRRCRIQAVSIKVKFIHSYTHEGVRRMVRLAEELVSSKVICFDNLTTAHFHFRQGTGTHCTSPLPSPTLPCLASFP